LRAHCSQFTPEPTNSGLAPFLSVTDFDDAPMPDFAWSSARRALSSPTAIATPSAANAHRGLACSSPANC